MVGCELGERHNAVDLCMFGMFTKESVGYRSSQVFWRESRKALEYRDGESLSNGSPP